MKLTAQISLFRRVTFIDKLIFTKHLAVMVKAGIPLSEAITIARDQTKDEVFKKVLREVGDDVSNGQTLQKALAKHPKVFDPLYLSLVNIGEESGNLEQNLEYLAAQLQKGYEFKKKVQGAMLYPAFVIIVALILGGGIALFVLPQLVNLFSSLDADLPLTTKILLWVAQIMRDYGWLIVIGVTALGIGFVSLTKTRLVKPFWHRFLLKIPILGKFLEAVQIATFCRNLGLVLKSGVPISRGLAIIRDSTENLIFRDYVQDLLKAVEKGKTIESELGSGRYPHVPLIVARMVGVGERTGKLDEILLYLGDLYESDVDTMAKNFPTILEPILLVAIAGMVAFLSFSIISPIYEFTASIHR